MLSDILQLLKPLQYLCVTNTRRGLYQVFLPAIITAITILLVIISDKTVSDALKAIFEKASTILVLMIPFNITALAAIATFQSPNLDSPLSGNPVPSLRRKVRGVYADEILTRRRYLCLLFGYMSVLGIIMFLLCIAAAVVGGMLAHSPGGTPYFEWLMIAIISFLSGNYLTNTLLGLFYLSDRIHRND